MDEQQYKDRIQALEDELALERTRVEHWKSLYLAANQKRFGKSIESSHQLGLDLFDEAETEVLCDALENTEGQPTEQKVKSYIRRSSQNRMLTLDPSTPVVDIRHDAQAPVCSCESTMVKCGEFVRDTLSVIPASKVIVRHHYPRFECTNCLPEPGQSAKVVVCNDDSVLAGTVCDPSLLATIVTDKMQFGLPLYRQEQKLIQEQRGLSRQAMSGWMMLAGGALENLGKALERALHSYPLWNVDETGIRILSVPGQKESDSNRNCFMIVRAATDRDGSRGPVVFTFSEQRTDAVIAGMLKDYKKAVQSDGLSGYRNATAGSGGFTHLGCMVHARRKAAEILKTNKRAKLAGELVLLYATFFHHEGELADAQKGPGALTGQQYLAKRREVLEPDLAAIKQWLLNHSSTVLKGSDLATAIYYPLSRWEELTAFLDYSYATSSNQLAENCIRPFAVARKNFLFCITPQGAKVSALYYSLVESCKAMEINPHSYLTHVFANAGNCRTDEDWDALVPGRVDLSNIDDYYAMLRSAVPDPDRTQPYILRGKKH
ncbi:MAG: IS66 family transposase [Sphaerochaeta sp.]|nr:IS66 family transposase [Sphaerochaeta sp.]NCC85490.1 IS66 family transposase [Clostridia bacterium]